ncbi:MAG: ammonia permease, partial [Deltaproteobacteria bacterium]|nr:ammonia permease [Deltaproteobacteria bacterium]
MKRLVSITIMFMCLFFAAGMAVFAAEPAPGQASPAVAMPTAMTHDAATAPASVVTQKALDDMKSSLQVGVDTVWVLFTAFLVFFMNLGFAMVESGLCRAKNSVNILTKNFIVFAVASLSFWFIGWGLMFGNGSPFAGMEGLFFAGGADNSPAIGE